MKTITNSEVKQHWSTLSSNQTTSNPTKCLTHSNEKSVVENAVIRDVAGTMVTEISNHVNAPEYLDAKLLEEALENAVTSAPVTLKGIHFESGCSGGDNYCSALYRIRLTFTREDSNEEDFLSLIVKSIPITDAIRILADLRVFFKEKIFCSRILPRLEVLLNNVKFGPQVYYSQKDPVNTIVFEDLCALGYEMADRVDGLDFKHCALVMKKLGQFHGSSIVLHEKDPKSMEAFKGGMLQKDALTKNEQFCDGFFGGKLRCLIDAVKDWEGFGKIREKLKHIEANLLQSLGNSQQPREGEIRVLNHGDVWVNNFMFKYTNGDKSQLEDIVFVDMQMTIFGSPGYDLNYFLNTSLKYEVLTEKRDDLLKIYYASLSDTLQTLKYSKIPTFECILDEVRLRESYGLFAAYGIFPLIAMDKEISADNTLDNVTEGDESVKKIALMFSSPRCQKTLKYSLRRFDELGVLDSF